MTTTSLSASEVDTFDYLIVGGGTAGCVIASRLAEYLPKKRILLIEAGPSDYMNDKVLNLKDWLNLLGGELDYDYGTTEQPNGKCVVWLCLLLPSDIIGLGYIRRHCLRQSFESKQKALKQTCP